MAIFQYRCPNDGVFDLPGPMGTALPTHECPTCGARASRVFSVALLARSPGGLMRMIDRDERSTDAPEVTATLPPRSQRRSPALHPAMARLPRP